MTVSEQIEYLKKGMVEIIREEDLKERLEQCAKAGYDSEATILCFETPHGNVYLNISMHYQSRRSRERTPVTV